MQDQPSANETQSPPDWTEHFEAYQQLAKSVCPCVKITTKDHPFWVLVSWMLFFLSIGQFSRANFLIRFATTLGPIQAYPRGWQILSKRLLVHEARHTEQFLFAGWFVPVLGWMGAPIRVWAGVLPMAFVYGCLPFPILFSWGRFRLELDAESHSWRIGLAEGFMTPEQVRERAEEFGTLVSSWAYLRSWPRKWTLAAFHRRAEQIISEWENTSGV